MYRFRVNNTLVFFHPVCLHLLILLHFIWNADANICVIPGNKFAIVDFWMTLVHFTFLFLMLDSKYIEMFKIHSLSSFVSTLKCSVSFNIHSLDTEICALETTNMQTILKRQGEKTNANGWLNGACENWKNRNRPTHGQCSMLLCIYVQWMRMRENQYVIGVKWYWVEIYWEKWIITFGLAIKLVQSSENMHTCIDS